MPRFPPSRQFSHLFLVNRPTIMEDFQKMPKKAVAGRVAEPIEVVALACAFKEKAIKEAKQGLPEDSIHAVNLTVEIVGSIAKSGGIDDGEMVSPKVDLTKLPTTCEVLRKLGIGPKRLKEALLETGEVEEGHEADELATVFEETAREIASSLPQVPAKGVSPKVTSVLSVRVLKAA